MEELPEDIINGLEKRIRKQVCDEIRKRECDLLQQENKNSKAIEVLERIKEKFSYQRSHKLAISSDYLTKYINKFIKKLKSDKTEKFDL